MDEVQEAAAVQANLEALPVDAGAEEILEAITGYSEAAVSIALYRTAAGSAAGSSYILLEEGS